MSSRHSHMDLKQISPLLLKLLQFSHLRPPFALSTAVLHGSFPPQPQTLLHSCFPEQHFSAWMFVHHYFVLRMFVVLLWAVSSLACHFHKFVFILPTYGLLIDFPPSLEKLHLTVLCRDSPDLSLLQYLPSIWDTTSESLIPGFSIHRQEQCK